MIPTAQAKDLIEKLKINPFLEGPAQSLCKAIALEIAATPEWRYIFGENIDVYQRTDYNFRLLPALRIYTERYRKLHESHYIEGDVVIDVIYPADIRRAETSDFPDIISSAMMQQFRRPNVMQRLQAQVPGINELGKVFSVDKTQGLDYREQGQCPVTEMTANFRIDLKVWDAYLESTGRTKEDPYNVTLADLRTVASRLLPVREGTPDHDAQVDSVENLTLRGI